MNDACEQTPGIASQCPADNDDRFSLPSRYYTDPDIFALECERIFYRCWNFAGHRTQFRQAGDYLTCMVAEESIIVMLGEDCVLRAFYNVCRHRGHWLLEGSGHTSAITCPYHAWRYSTNGQLLYARNADKIAGFEHSAFCLSEVKVEEFCGFVFVNLDADAKPLCEQVPGLAEELRAYEPRVDQLQLVYRKAFSIASNWKNVVDNYNENYHTPVVHPVLASVLDDSYRVELKGRYLTHSSDASPGLEGGFDLGGEDYSRHLTWWLWPNLAPMSIPGGGLRVLHIMPDGPERTLENYDFYLPTAEPSQKQWQQIHYAADVINVEDLGVAEGIQRGLRSRSFDRSYIMLDPQRGAWSEHAVKHFKSLVEEALVG